MRNLLLCLSCSVLFPAPLAAQEPLEILKNVAGVYRNLGSYDVELTDTYVHRSPTSQSQNESRQRFASAMGKSRSEWGPDSLSVEDGQFRWNYDKVNNGYTKTPSASRREQVLSHAAIAQYVSIAQQFNTARIERQETLDLGGVPVSCYVVVVDRNCGQVKPPPESLEFTYWIDASRNLVLKSIERLRSRMPDGGQTETIKTVAFTRVSINQRLPDLLFQFRPPEGAKQVEEIRPGRRSPLTGQDIPDFQVKSIDGRAITASMLRGNVAVVQFGAGQEHVDESLPFIELLHRLYKGQGVAVVFICRSPSAEILKRGLTLPFVTDSGGELAKQFGISSIGTVVADRNGRIVSVLSEAAGETEWVVTKELQKAGVW